MDIKVERNTVVVFDLDDTIYNELDYLKSAYQYIARQIEPAQWQALYAYMISLFRSKEDVFGYIADEYGMDKSELLNTYREHLPSIQPFEGFREVLMAIRDKKAKVGILTDGRVLTQMNKIRALGIERQIDHIAISEAIGTEKPNERNYLVFENLYKGGAYIYIADNLRKDFLCPNDRGWHTIGKLDNGLNMHHDAFKYFDNSHKPRTFFNSYLEINIV